MEVFQSHFGDLCDIVKLNVLQVTNKCTSLIGSDVRNYILTAQGVGNYEKATKLLYEIESQLTSHCDKEKYLLSVIEAFLKVKNSQLGKLAMKMKDLLQ